MSSRCTQLQERQVAAETLKREKAQEERMEGNSTWSREAALEELEQLRTETAQLRTENRIIELRSQVF